ncbi:hypothetical protein IOD14_19250 [Streptomyces sp. A2-16]|nr:hypothetical protein IOD14_19250 [Streptomyces sp. A2-16]
MGTVRLGRHSGGVHTPSPARSSGSPPTVFARTRAAVLPVAETRSGADVEAGTARADTSGPCDFCAAGGTPCVAAHSTARASYGSCGGPLHQVWRVSDTTTRSIGTGTRSELWSCNGRSNHRWTLSRSARHRTGTPTEG